MSDQYLSIGKAAEFLGISRDTLRRWEKKGKIKSKRLDGKTRHFKITDLEEIKYGEYLGVKEAAARIGVSPSTLRRLADKGIIPSEREKNRYRKFRVKDLEKFIASNDYPYGSKEIEIEAFTGGKKVIVPKEKIPPAYLSTLNLSFIKLKRKFKSFFNSLLLTSVLVLHIFLLSFVIITLAFIFEPVGTAKFFKFKLDCDRFKEACEEEDKKKMKKQSMEKHGSSRKKVMVPKE